MSYEDQTATLIVEVDEEILPFVGEPIWVNYVNDFGAGTTDLVQSPDFTDFTIEDERLMLAEVDAEDAVANDLIKLEAQEAEQAVPYDWRYWEHDENTLPPVDESSAPPLPSGWVDPDTGLEIP